MLPALLVVPGLIHAGAEDRFNHKQGPTALRLSLSPSNPDMTKVLFYTIP